MNNNSGTPSYSEFTVFSDYGSLRYLFFCLCLLTYMTIISANLVIVLTVCVEKSLHQPMYIFICCLSLNSLDLLCSLQAFVNYSIISASIGGMVLISADRYVAICDPLHYPTRVTVRRVRIWISMCWFCSLCVILIDDITTAVDIVLSFIGPFTAIIVLYMRVFLTAVSQARAMRSHVAATTLHHSGNVLSKKSELKAARTLGIVVAWFLICFCPFYCLGFVPSSYFNNLPATSGIFLLCISPCLNPVIYALFYPWFRKAIRLIISLQILYLLRCLWTRHQNPVV
uniref:G-protein coupled receptors family 1 profile domain-containing protein n=1 Tax=Anabas testudineus TaxID=64144 RepID=A0A7N5ZXF9_ANATE